MANLAQNERALYKMRRRGAPLTPGFYNDTDTTKSRYGSNFEGIEQNYYLMYGDYLRNLLINLIKYENVPITFDMRYAEFCLRNFGYVRVGGLDKDNIFVLQPDGNASQTNPQVGAFGFIQDALDQRIPNPIKDGAQLYQITRPNVREVKRRVQAESTEGAYVVLSNKYSYFYRGLGSTMMDADLDDRTAQTLAKIKATEIYNLEQMKIPYVGYTTNKNLTSKNIFSNIQQGIPFIELDADIQDVNKMFGVMNLNVPNYIADLKDAWNNELTELLTMLGINNIGVDKKERLVANEVNANSQLIEASGNIYLDARNNQFELLNEVFGTNIKAVFNQDAYNQLVSLTKQKDELESDFDNDIKHDEEESDNG